jgi:hypothetical protein
LERMQSARDGEITGVLGAFGFGEPEAEARLMDLTYRELRKIAAGHLRRERSGRSLQTTDPVHEAHLRLVDQAGAPWRRPRPCLSGGRARHAPDSDRSRPQAPHRGGCVCQGDCATDRQKAAR